MKSAIGKRKKVFNYKGKKRFPIFPLKIWRTLAHKALTLIAFCGAWRAGAAIGLQLPHGAIYPFHLISRAQLTASTSASWSDRHMSTMHFTVC